MAIEFDLDGRHADKAYAILTSLVTPRPIALITTINESGVVNAAPFSFFNVFGSKPPMVVVAPGNKEPGIPKDTARNIRRSREFVVHMVDQSIAQQMAGCAAGLAADESEIDHVGFNTISSSVIGVPRIAEAPVALECREHTTLEIGNNRLVVGTVHRIHVRDGLMDPDSGKLLKGDAIYSPIGRMASPNNYCRTTETFQID